MLRRFPAPRLARGGEPFDVPQGREPAERLVEPRNTSSYLRIEALNSFHEDERTFSLYRKFLPEPDG